MPIIYRGTLGDAAGDFNPAALQSLSLMLNDEIVWAIADPETKSCVIKNAQGQSLSHRTIAGFPLAEPPWLPNAVGPRRVWWELCPQRAAAIHPRIWRSEAWIRGTNPFYHSVWASSSRSLSGIVLRLLEVLRFVEPSPANASTYGHEIRHLLILASTEIESGWRAVLKANEYVAADPRGRLTTEDYFKLCAPMRLNEWTLRLRFAPEFGSIAPFAGWRGDAASQSLAWYTAYNETKHDREQRLSAANLKHATDAVAGAYVMSLAQFGEIEGQRIPGLEEFDLVKRPAFTAAETYVPPPVVDRQQWDVVPYFQQLGASGPEAASATSPS